jgi:hypothetical protein
VANKNITGMSPTTLLVVQALKALGKDRIDSTAIEKIRQRLTDAEVNQLVEQTARATAWIKDAVRQIAEIGETE